MEGSRFRSVWVFVGRPGKRKKKKIQKGVAAAFRVREKKKVELF